MKPKWLSEYIVYNDERLTKKIIYAEPDMLMFVLNLKPGQKLPRHGHENGTLAIQILAGNGTIKINDTPERLESGQLYYLAGTDMLEVPEVTENLSLLVTIAPNPSNPIFRQPR